MKKTIPNKFKDKILEMPEYKYGVNKVKIKLKDGKEIRDVHIAWGEEIVKVGNNKNIKFDIDEIIDVENDS